MRWFVMATCFALAAPVTGALAQEQDQTLADIRQELSVLYVDLQRLKRELSTTGAPSGAAGGTILQRVNAIEGQMQRLTAKTEELEFRINRIATDGGNRVGDLEFRFKVFWIPNYIMNRSGTKRCTAQRRSDAVIQLYVTQSAAFLSAAMKRTIAARASDTALQ